MPTLEDALRARLDAARDRLERLTPAPHLAEVGHVEQIGDGVATLSGLPSARLDELLLFPGAARGMAVTLDRDRIGAVLLDTENGIGAGSEVRGSGEVVRVPVGEGLLGRVIDPLGRPRDGGPAPAAERHDPIERPGPAIVTRDFVVEPLQTGVLVVDALVPLGRGQRELIIGDRQTGKTSLALDAMLNQRRSEVVCIYCAVGQKTSAVRQVIETMQSAGPFGRAVFVVAEADDAPGLQWIAPYAAMTVAEYFRDRGGHALLVLDDLTKHAHIHRQISLLLRNPPGREAYPGDVFYMHARLLERAAKLSRERGGGSITALPIAETQAGNLSAYIPTNLISITDGQVYLDPKLFNAGQKPAVDVGLSVSRIGGKTQAPAVKTLSGRLRLDYAQFLELELFTRFGQMVDPRTERIIAHGRHIRAVLTQPQGRPLGLAAEVTLLLAVQENILDALPLEAVGRFKARIEEDLERELRDLAERIAAGGALEAADRAALCGWLRARAQAFAPAPPPASGAATGA